MQTETIIDYEGGPEAPLYEHDVATIIIHESGPQGSGIIALYGIQRLAQAETWDHFDAAYYALLTGGQVIVGPVRATPYLT
jgi:hypothetical protein